MIENKTLSLASFEEAFLKTVKMREDVARQDEALEDMLELRKFAMENGLEDKVVESFFEEALIKQHKYMQNKDEKFLEEMAEAVEEVSAYVSEKGLGRWESRLARYKGRLADYRKDFVKAIEYYQEAIDKSISDPKYAENPALSFEYRGFMIIDKIRLSNIKEGIEEAEALYEDYLFSEDGSGLKQRDYATWAIWRSAVFINLSKSLIEMNLSTEYKSKILEWLSSAERNLKAPEGVDVWTDFAFRKKEVADIREMLG